MTRTRSPVLEMTSKITESFDLSEGNFIDFDPRGRPSEADPAVFLKPVQPLSGCDEGGVGEGLVYGSFFSPVLPRDRPMK